MLTEPVEISVGSGVAIATSNPKADNTDECIITVNQWTARIATAHLTTMITHRAQHAIDVISTLRIRLARHPREHEKL